MPIYLTPTDPDAQPAIKMMKAAFPSYSGRKFEIHIAETVDVRSSWCEGSRDTFVFVELETGAVSNVVPSQSAFDRLLDGAHAVPLPDGIGCVEQSIFQGKHMGLKLIIASSNSPRWLPAKVELTETEGLVLVATDALKNSYSGEKDIRFSRVHRQRGTTRAAWDAALITLKARKMLTAQGAITAEGRNAITDHPLRYQLTL
jgi:hypothetical protein